MYESFFGFREKPFKMTPDPRFLYLSRKHKEALSHLIYGMRERAGFVVLSGEVGTGKTTMVRVMLDRLDENCRVAYIYNPRFSVTDFLKFTCHDLGFKVDGDSKLDYLIKLHSSLIESHNDGKTVAMIVDEAQNLDPSLFEEIRMLTNLETAHEKLLQVFLVGQPELNELLDRPGSKHVKQRISARYHLLPLDRKETKEYIHTRMRIAGAKRPNCFTEGAMQRIFEYSQGVPRLINSICHNSLVMGFAADRPIVNEKMVRECAADLKLEGPSEEVEAGGVTKADTRARPSPVSASLMIVLMVLLVCGIALFLLGNPSTSQTLSRLFDRIPLLSRADEETTEENTGVIQKRSFSEETGILEPLAETEDAPAVGAYIPEPSPEMDSLRELTEESGGAEADQIVDTSQRTSGIESQGEAAEESEAGLKFQISSYDENPEARIAIVGKGDTVSRILLREFQRVDTHLIEATRKLNPEIQDLDKILLGQSIRLPSHPETAYERPGGASYFSIHLASFRQFDWAQNLVNELIESGAKPSIASVKLHKEGLWYRVTIGEYQSLAEASLEAKRLEQSGQFTYAKPIKLNDFGDGRVKRATLE